MPLSPSILYASRYSHKYFRFSLFCILHVSSSDNFLESKMLLAISFFTEDLLFYVRNKLTIVIWRESEWWWAHSYPAFGPFGIYKRLFIKNVYLYFFILLDFKPFQQFLVSHQSRRSCFLFVFGSTVSIVRINELTICSSRTPPLEMPDPAMGRKEKTISLRDASRLVKVWFYVTFAYMV